MRFTLLLITILVAKISASQGSSCTPVVTQAYFSRSLDWNSYIDQNINKFLPKINCAPAGNYKIDVRFIIDRDGTICDVKALTKHGYGMEEEVRRVIIQSPAWTPATHNGRAIRDYCFQTFTFYVVHSIE